MQQAPGKGCSRTPPLLRSHPGREVFLHYRNETVLFGWIWQSWNYRIFWQLCLGSDWAPNRTLDRMWQGNQSTKIFSLPRINRNSYCLDATFLQRTVSHTLLWQNGHLATPRCCFAYPWEKIEQYKKEKSPQALKGLKKNYKNTEAYIHLTLEERKRFINELAAKIKSWTFLRLFGEVIDKNNYHPPKPGIIPQTQAFERIVTRIEKYLSHISMETNEYGLLIHDECESVAAAHVSKMKQYHIRGTFKSRVDHIIETPLFVSSNHTNMVQIADLCAYILRRYYDLGEQTLYDVIKTRIDKAGGDVVGLNHYTNNKDCPCEVCRKKRRKQTFSHHSL